MLYALGSHEVKTDSDNFFVAPTASVIGQVRLGSDANIWFGAVVRADTNRIEIGDRSNVQDTAVVHVDHDAPVVISTDVTIGHGATVHGCSVGHGSLIGIGATILSHSVIGEYCIVGAGALITERKQFPDRSLIIGAPARVTRQVTNEEIEMLKESAAHYVELGKQYRNSLRSADSYSF